MICFYRIYGHSFAFSIVSLGNVPMPGPVVITYPDSVGHVTTGNRTMLLHWNPGLFVMKLTDIIFSFRIQEIASILRHFGMMS